MIRSIRTDKRGKEDWTVITKEEKPMMICRIINRRGRMIWKRRERDSFWMTFRDRLTRSMPEK